ncbi:MAG: class I SAM-dependent methyltransferase [Neisseria sp.]|nr:class I SAM-dependent methyltransferase [Neisseria sp.]
MSILPFYWEQMPLADYDANAAQNLIADLFNEHNPLVHFPTPEIVSELPSAGLYFHVNANGISLAKVGEKGRVQVDFVDGAAGHRRKHGGGELLGKAVNHSSKPVVWDATGGLGRDAFVLASLGLDVQIFERNPNVALLLADGIRRATQHADTAEIAQKMRLNVGNAIELLPELAQANRPDVVYLDPMYPTRQKSAAVKKEMAYFHDLVGAANDADDAALLAAACAIAKKRVVVKRPRLGEFLANEKPAYQYSGKSTRFDVYLPLNPVSDSQSG